MKKKPSIGALLPSLVRRGGVRQFLEIGNIFIRRGYDYKIITEPGLTLDWFDFKGKIVSWEPAFDVDILIVGDPQFLERLLLVQEQMKKKGGKIFVWVIAAYAPYKEMYDPYYGKFPFMLINRSFLKWYPDASLCEMGVNNKHFTLKKRKVLYFSADLRAGQHKQAHIIREQLEDLPNIELVDLKNLTNDEIAEVYKSADSLVAWELDGGYCNPAAEAVASGLQVVTNGNGCEPFIDKVIVTKNLREFFTDPMKNNTWEKTVDDMLKIIL